MPLLLLYSKIALDRGEFTIGVFIYLSKAFESSDTIAETLLLLFAQFCLGMVCQLFSGSQTIPLNLSLHLFSKKESLCPQPLC